MLVVLGPSGAGKTTLLDSIAGFRSADRRPRATRRTRAHPDSLPSGAGSVSSSSTPRCSHTYPCAKTSSSRSRARGEDTPRSTSKSSFTRFGISDHAERRPRSLSGGERQRVALARALAAEPDLLLLDEPLSALDQPTREELRGVLQDLLSSLGIPAVHVTHDRDEALTLANDIAIIVNGQLRQLQPAHEITSQPADADVARLLGWSELGHGPIQARPDHPR